MQYTNIFNRPATRVGIVAGIISAIAYALFIGFAMHSAIFGLVEGLIFGIVAGLFAGWRVREHNRLTPAAFQSWSPRLTVAFVVGLIVFFGLFIEAVHYSNTAIAIWWAVLGVAYLAIVVALPSLNRRSTKGAGPTTA